MAGVHPLKYSLHSRLRESRLKKLLPPGPGKMLDLGCGLGYLTETLGQGFIAVGLESDLHACRLNCQRRTGLMVNAFADATPFRTAAFDLIICSEVLEHLPPDQVGRAVAEMARVLRPGGRALFTVPSLEGLRAHSRLRNLGHDDPSGGEYHYRVGFSWPELRDEVERSGRFKIVARRYSMFFFSAWFMDIVKWVYFKKNKLTEHSDLMTVNESFLFNIYRRLFSVLVGLFRLEDAVLTPLFKGHILIVAAERTGRPAGSGS